VKRVNLSETRTIRTGFRELDKKILGLNLGEVTLLSGSNSAGKSSWLNTLILNVINDDNKVALWSGELPPDKLKMWLHNAAAGKENIVSKQRGEFTIYETTPQASALIDQWLDGKFFLYNNEYTSKWEQILHDINELIKLGVNLFILDNLFSMDIDIFDGDKNNKQKELILQICQLARTHRIHIILVAHPRKSIGFLRKTDISGTADLTNAVDNVFICHRVNNDFLKTGSDFLGSAKIQEYSGFGNCVEVCKNRMFGVVDFLVGMYYEIESRRFKNDINEKVVYGWQSGEQDVRTPYREDNEMFTMNTNEVPF
jgi:archaellum biogenesis ATPase FlaH